MWYVCCVFRGSELFCLVKCSEYILYVDMSVGVWGEVFMQIIMFDCLGV